MARTHTTPELGAAMNRTKGVAMPRKGSIHRSATSGRFVTKEQAIRAGRQAVIRAGTERVRSSETSGVVRSSWAASFSKAAESRLPADTPAPQRPSTPDVGAMTPEQRRAYIELIATNVATWSADLNRRLA
ncbi:hypothetical protein SEA_MORGANA_122 [Gordonia phage Morgana]|uniref:DNA binding protein n=1 Tax=Gordonia phage Morgana TaxID=3137292 RepID=A0AAX4RBX6_9CAUD